MRKALLRVFGERIFNLTHLIVIGIVNALRMDELGKIAISLLIILFGCGLANKIAEKYEE